MSTYKVIQDIEAEDKLLGPLSLRQFIYALIVIAQAFIAYRLAVFNIFLTLPFLPGIILFGFLAAPLGHDQPSEIWLLARIRFFLKPRRRIWDQSGFEQLVTVTAPKKEQKQYTNGLSQTEVKSRLKTLADTIDSRGWASKNVNVNMFTQPGYTTFSNDSDRLIAPSELPREVNDIGITASDDMLDEVNNPTAHHFDQLIQASGKERREQIIARMKGSGNTQSSIQPPLEGTPSQQAWFMNQQTVTGSTEQNRMTTEQALLRRLEEEKTEGLDVPIIKEHENAVTMPPAQNSQNTLHTNTAGKQAARANNVENPKMTAPLNPDILRLATNDDLNVATLSREANRSKKQYPPEDEVVISLH